MTPGRYMNMIYNAFIKYDTTVHLFGDQNQNIPVQNDTSIIHDYNKSFAIRQMCPQTIQLEYIRDVSQYDDKMNHLLDEFLKSGMTKHIFKPINANIMKHICYLNKTRRKINNKCCDMFIKGKDYQEIRFIYSNKSEIYKVYSGMPIIATRNMKEHGIFNMMEFEIDKIEDDHYYINNIKFEKDEFRCNFLPNFCNTIYRYQGCSIDVPYCIHDIDRMDKRELYTSLSRTTSIDYIHLENSQLKNVYTTRDAPDMEIINSHFDSNYKNGKIYMIKFNNDMIYIGMTCDKLQNRLKWHLTNIKSQVYKMRDHQPQISLIVNAPCHDKRALEAFESKYIHEYSIIHGDKLLNKRMNHIRKIKPIKYSAFIENEKTLKERIAHLEDKIKIIDDEKNQYLYFKTTVKGNTHRAISRYRKQSKESALESIRYSKSELIKRLTIDLD